MKDHAEIAAQIGRMAQGVFGLEGEERVAAYADEVAEMLLTMSSVTLEKTQEPFAPPVDDAAEEER